MREKGVTSPRIRCLLVNSLYMDIKMQEDKIRESLGKSWEDVRETFSGYGVHLEESDRDNLVSIILSPKREDHVHLDGSVNFELLRNL